jgi:prefoldin alpha subunit
MSAEKGMEVNLATLSLEQLKQFHGQCVQEIQILQQSLSNLKMVQSSFVSSETSLDQLRAVEANKEILVPLTGSLYVPGKLIRNDRCGFVICILVIKTRIEISVIIY